MHADIDGRRLFYLRRGGGEPLLLIQGMAGHHALWREDFVDLLAAEFDVIYYDHRGVGESTDVPGSFTIADLADDAAALLGALDCAHAHVFGISLGGMVAQELALRHPDKVRSLVLGCTYCGGEGSMLSAPGPMRMLEAMNTGDVDNAIRASFYANLSPAWTAVGERLAEFSDIALSVHVPVPLVMRQAQAAFAHDTSTRLPSLAAPTLVLAGTADEMVNWANSSMIASLIPNSTLQTFDDVGHLFWWERMPDTAEAIRTHLASSTDK